MKNFSVIIFGLWLTTSAIPAFSQRAIAEGTIVYDMTIQTSNSVSQKATVLEGSTTTIYLKGNNSRSEMVSSLGNETTIYNGKSGSAVILKEFNGQKLMIKLSKENWDLKNKINNGTSFELTNEVKTISGYTCKKAIGKMADGKSFIVFYSPDITVVNKDYNPTFINLPGLAMQYEIESGKLKFKYTIAKISFDAVLVSKFDFPASGYRVMTYEENQQMNKGN